jgi:hypothetical protein
MPELENDAARLKSVSYLLGEALRITDEGNRSHDAARIADCKDFIELELARVIEQLDKRRHG